jgi:Flp pilus assembly protein TadG
MIARVHHRLLRDLRENHEGAALVEFALIAPIFLLMLLGAFDLGQSIYARAVLQGAVQDAGRDAGLESGQEGLTQIDEYVLGQVKHIAPAGAVVTSRKNYKAFADVGKPEDFDDANNNNSYDADECFTDINGNGTWDTDRSKGGLGGADDVVVYTATLTYNRIVPLWKFMGWSEQNSVSATTTLRSQPFGDQATRPEVLVCP